MPQYQVEALRTIRTLQAQHETAGHTAQAEQMRKVGDQVEAMQAENERLKVGLSEIAINIEAGMRENKALRAELDDAEWRVEVAVGQLAALEARHNALREAVHMAMDRTAGCDKKQTDDQLIADVAYLKRLASDYFKTSVDCGNRAFAAEQKYDALREAVAWEREFDEVLVWLVQTGRYPRDMAGKYDLAAERDCSRAEVDRLLENES